LSLTLLGDGAVAAVAVEEDAAVDDVADVAFGIVVPANDVWIDVGSHKLGGRGAPTKGRLANAASR
jgi:hypothetical protein